MMATIYVIHGNVFKMIELIETVRQKDDKEFAAL